MPSTCAAKVWSISVFAAGVLARLDVVNGIAPCGCRIPGILRRRIVIRRDAVDHRHAAKVQSVGIAYVEIIPCEQMRRRRAEPLRVIGALDKGADMIGDGAPRRKDLPFAARRYHLTSDRAPSLRYPDLLRCV